MRRLLLVSVVVLAIAVGSCTKPAVVGGDAVAGEIESAADEATGSPDDRSTTSNQEPEPDETAASPGPSDESAAPGSAEPTGATPIEPSTPQATTTTTTASDSASDEGYPTSTVNPSLVERAMADLAHRLGLDEGLIDVKSVHQVEWPDRAFGCPEPGKFYAQVISFGWQIILVHNGVSYFYHSGGGGDPFYCASPAKPL